MIDAEHGLPSRCHVCGKPATGSYAPSAAATYTGLTPPIMLPACDEHNPYALRFEGKHAADRKRAELLAKLRAIKAREGDAELDHREADKLLLDYIGDDEIRAAFEAIEKWYV